MKEKLFCNRSLGLLLIVNCVLLFASCTSKEQIQLEQYYIGGKATYETNCANCHQKNGKGLGTLYPPIVGSKVLTNKENVICLIRNGSSKAGSLTKMPVNHQLLDLDIAELTTYIYNEWGNEKNITATETVHKVLEKCNK